MKYNDRFYQYFQSILEVSVNKICKDIRIVDPNSYIDSPKSNFYNAYHYINFKQRENYELKGFYKRLLLMVTDFVVYFLIEHDLCLKY